MAALGFEPWQWAALAVAYAALFIAPAVWMFRKARQDGDNGIIWALLVGLTSLIGIIEYYEHRSILKRRAKRGEPPEEP